VRAFMPSVGAWLLALAAAAPASALVVRGDANWRGTEESCPSDWSDPRMDDSAWPKVVYPWRFMTPQQPPGLLEARPFWSTAAGGITCVRRHVSLPHAPQQPAVVRIWVDDDYELYINGTFVGASTDQAHPLPGETYEVTPLLHAGDNLIALKLLDYGGERGALFSLSVPDVPDVPLTLGDGLRAIEPWLLLLAFAVAAVLAVRAGRWLGRRAGATLRRVPPAATAAAAILAVIACQWFLQSGEFYSVPIPYRGHALAQWNWPQCCLLAALLAVLVLAARSHAASDEARKAARGWLWLAAILALAVALRTVALDSVPMGFVQDEAINGNESVALLDGRPFILWSDSIGGRPTLFLYLLGACLQVFGRSYLALKVLPVAIGVASVVAVYAFGRVALGPRAALWAAFLLAISWWHNHYSRLALEACCVPLFSTAGLALLLHGLGRSRRPFASIVAGSVLLATGLYTYAAYRAVPVAAVLFLAATAVSRDRQVLRARRVPLCAGGIVALAIVTPLALFAWRHPELYWRRYEDVSIMPLMRYYWTALPWLHQMGKGLLALNHRGYDAGNWVPTFLDPVTGALLLLGLVVRPSEQQRRGVRLLWVWFLTFAALASLTVDSPQLTRQLGLLPPVVLFAGLGATHLVAFLSAALRRRALVWGCAAAAAAAAALVNVYLYFIAWQNVPFMDARMNTLAKSLCDTARRSWPVRFYVTQDLDYWASPQCAFLLPTGYAGFKVVRLEDLLDTRALRNAEGPVLLAVGDEFLTRYHDRLPLDTNGEPRFDLPVRPTRQLDREARPQYYLYRY
jgi:4-amino-4-deoxy-L-arabinose transferase-like glycosyltransferase